MVFFFFIEKVVQQNYVSFPPPKKKSIPENEENEILTMYFILSHCRKNILFPYVEKNIVHIP